MENRCSVEPNVPWHNFPKVLKTVPRGHETVEQTTICYGRNNANIACKKRSESGKILFKLWNLVIWKWLLTSVIGMCVLSGNESIKALGEIRA